VRNQHVGRSSAEYDVEACREIADLLEHEVVGAKKIDL
jgi:hypothetical protein